MSTTSPTALAALPDHVCEQARLSRDPRFDGLFFTAVTSTGIYCRPVCPAPAPKRESRLRRACSQMRCGGRAVASWDGMAAG
jgi:methylphosphotriester-DNA--protein-cysteine methyltransferase